MASGEQNITALPVKTNTGVANSDYFMGIDSAEGYQILIRDLAKYIMENYNGSTLAGSAQTPKAAIDALNSKQTFNITDSTGTWASELTLQGASYAQIIGNTVMLHLNLKIVSSTKKSMSITGVLPQNMRPRYDVMGIGGNGDTDGLCQPFTVNPDGSIRLWNSKTGTTYLQGEVTYLVNAAD